MFFRNLFDNTNDEKKHLERFFEMLVYGTVTVAFSYAYYFSGWELHVHDLALAVTAALFGFIRYHVLPTEKNAGWLRYTFEQKTAVIAFIDITFLIFAVAFTGGAESPLYVAFAFPILSSSLILKPRSIYQQLLLFLIGMITLHSLLYGTAINPTLVTKVLLLMMIFVMAITLAEQRILGTMALRRERDVVTESKRSLETTFDQIREQNEYLENVKRATINVLEDLESEKGRAERQALEALKFQKAVEAGADGTVITDTDGNIVYVNKAWEHITGYTLDEVRGKNPRFLKSGKTDPSIYPRMWGSILKGETFVSEDIFNKRKDGTEYQQRAVLFPIMENGKPQFFVGVIQDITERKTIEQHKTEFISIASHQLRTPLSAVNWFLEMLLSEEVGKLNKEQKDYLEQISFSTRRLVRLVNDLLNVSRIESQRLAINPAPIKLNELLDEVLHEQKLYFEAKNCAVKFANNVGEAQAIPLDPQVMKVVFDNLISNSVKYSPKSCTLEILLDKQGNEYIVTFVDTGMGIKAADQPHLFKKFYRGTEAVKLETEGSGLGLYITKQLVEESGGRIWFESEEGKGSRFHIAIPLSGSKKKEGERGILINKA